MNNLFRKKLILFILIFSFLTFSCNAGFFHSGYTRNAETKLFGKTLSNRKEKTAKKPDRVIRSKKKQEANEKKLKRDYAKSVRKSRQRSYKIQTVEVKARMKHNEKDIRTRDKSKRKRNKHATKKGGRKYN